jgi:hypothetical protein
MTMPERLQGVPLALLLLRFRRIRERGPGISELTIGKQVGSTTSAMRFKRFLKLLFRSGDRTTSVEATILPVRRALRQRGT